MKTRTLIILLGIVGIIGTSPFAFFAWAMYNGFGGALTFTDIIILWSPAPFAALLILGICLPQEGKDN